jgi:hypothetical protein
MTPNQLQTSHDALRFIVEFAQADILHAAPRQLATLEKGVQRFLDRDSDPHWYHRGEFDRQALEKLRERAARVLTRIATEPEGERVTVAGSLELSFVAIRQPDKRIRVIVLGSPFDRLPYLIIRLLEAVGVEKLRTCAAPDCGRMFLKVTRKAHCSARCQSRVYMRALRQQQREQQQEGSRHGKTSRKG